MRNIFIPLLLILNIISISIYGRSNGIRLQAGADNHLLKEDSGGVDAQSFTLDELWQLSSESATISRQLSDLNWHYDEFRSNVHLGNYSGTQIGSGFITLNGHTDVWRGMLDFTYQLNNALNADQMDILAHKAEKEEISRSEFMAGFGNIESAGIIDQLIVAAEMNMNAEAPFVLINMIQAYQSGEFDLRYLQNWTYRNYVEGAKYPAKRTTNMEVKFISVKTTAQFKTDSFIQTLHNRDVRLAIELVAREKTFDAKGSFQPSAVERILTSVNIDLVENTYPENLLVEKLRKLLDDPEKDWYANLLLYNLTGKSPAIPYEDVLRIDNRMAWLKPMGEGRNTYKSNDKKMWEEYFSNGNMNKKY